MSFKLKIDIDAFQDIEEAAEWYELQSKGLGLRYKSQVKKQINSLKKNPYLFSIKYNDIRCRKIDKFPFLIHYLIDQEFQLINVFAVFPPLEIRKSGKETLSKLSKKIICL